MTDISITLNDDGTGTIVIAGVPVNAAPVSPPPPPAPVAKFSITQSDNRVAVWDKSKGFPPDTKGTLDWGDNSTPGSIVAAQTGSVGHTYADGKYTITQKYTVDGVDYVWPVDVTVPKAPPSDPPPADNTPTASNATKDVPSVAADGQSILYHYPMDVTLAAEVDHIEIPGTFGGAPEVVAKIAWNFGDGSNGFGADGRHPYDKPGTYTITGSVNYKDGRTVPFGPLTVTAP